MTNTPHELAEEFPDLAGKISELKQTDAHFARLADEYHDINGRIHRAETLIEPMEEQAEHGLRKERARLKDEIYRWLSA